MLELALYNFTSSRKVRINTFYRFLAYQDVSKFRLIMEHHFLQKTVTVGFTRGHYVGLIFDCMVAIIATSISCFKLCIVSGWMVSTNRTQYTKYQLHRWECETRSVVLLNRPLHTHKYLERIHRRIKHDNATVLAVMAVPSSFSKKNGRMMKLVHMPLQTVTYWECTEFR